MVNCSDFLVLLPAQASWHEMQDLKGGGIFRVLKRQLTAEGDTFGWISGPIHFMTFIQEDSDALGNLPTYLKTHCKFAVFLRHALLAIVRIDSPPKRWLESLKLLSGHICCLKKHLHHSWMCHAFLWVSPNAFKKSMAEAFYKMGCSSSAPTKMTAPQAAFQPKVHGLRNDGPQPQT